MTNIRKPHEEAETPRKKSVPKPRGFKPTLTFDNGKPRCIAWARSSGRQCRRPPEPGKRVCRFHGGANGSGRPPVHGKHTSLAKLSADAERYLTDSNLTNLRGELWAVSFRFDQLIGRIADANPSPDFAAIRQAAEDVAAAVTFGGTGKVSHALGRLLALVDLGAAEERSWTEVRRVANDIRKLAAEQRDSELATGGMWPSIDVLTLIGKFQRLMYQFIPAEADRRTFLRVFESQINGQ